MPAGKIIEYDKRLGRGKLEDEDDGRIISFNRNGIREPLLRTLAQPGQRVTYGLIKTAKGDFAIQIARRLT